MKFVDEYRDAANARVISQAIHKICKRSWTLMEICGGQTHAIVKYGISQFLPEEITLVHGPGCPVCVTPIAMIDKAIEIASRQDVIFCSFGDMLRVPGSERDLLSVKAAGGDVRFLYSPVDALTIAEQNPDKEVVFFAVGFETTAPANAMAVYQAKLRGISNFSMLVSHVLVPPAIQSILESPDNRVQGFLAPGHVCAIMGTGEYELLSKKYQVPIVVSGFEPLDILEGIYLCVKQLEEGKCLTENQYTRCVQKEGNRQAHNILQAVFEVAPKTWRGLGQIPESGFRLQKTYSQFDAETRFGCAADQPEPETECISGLILQGLKNPVECPAFGKRCTPEKPLGATMVSSEGACAAYYGYSTTSK